MHQSDLIDFTSSDIASTEQQNRGTMLHEVGHLFWLMDEYAGSSRPIWAADILSE